MACSELRRDLGQSGKQKFVQKNTVVSSRHDQMEKSTCLDS